MASVQANQAMDSANDEGVPNDQSAIWEAVLGVGTQSWIASLLIHMLVFIVLTLTLGTIRIVQELAANTILDAPREREEVASEEPDMQPMVLDRPASLEPSAIDLTQTKTAGEITGTPDGGMSEPGFPGREGDVPGVGGEPMGPPQTIFTLPPGIFEGLGGGPGGGKTGGIVSGDGGGSSDNPWIGRDPNKRRLGIPGVTPENEKSVSAAINWLYRHQNHERGNWSLDHRALCRGGACSGAGEIQADAAATALGLLPILAAGQTHQSKGPYQKTVYGGLAWLIKNQKPDGDLSAGGPQMYSHALATIALCEAYGMTHDSRIGYAAQAALNFIATGQNSDGGWRYTHGAADSDTSAVGWQVMALKSGVMAGLKVDPAKLAAAKKYLTKVSQGNYGSQFGYQPGGGPTETMTAVGLLLTQYLGAARGDGAIVGGTKYLSEHLPDGASRNVYYWYYATQVMHNVPGPEWDTWNRKVRRLLIETQARNGCESGSWSPEGDAWGKQGGRLMVTSLSCLTLEVYYRYLPLYQLDRPAELEAK